MTDETLAEHHEMFGCALVLRRVMGPHARELFIHGKSLDPSGGGTRGSSDAIYSALCQLLQDNDTDFNAVVAEWLFLAKADQAVAIRTARERVLRDNGVRNPRFATTDIVQPPLARGAGFEVMLHVVVPHEQPTVQSIAARTECRCDACARLAASVVHVGGERRLYAGGIHGRGNGAFDQTRTMFVEAENLLAAAGMQFSDVVRTWIHFREMERDYDAFNHGRRAFFKARQVDPIPASTGIGGGPVATHDLELGIVAVQSLPAPERAAMTAPTLNEAPEYGADFVRGLRVAQSNAVALYVSGTASVDERGATAHEGNFDAQAQRMLVNIGALLERQGASFRDIVSAITYVKRPEHAGNLRQTFHTAGFIDFPHVVVAAEICRPNLLVESEVFAALPVSGETLR